MNKLCRYKDVLTVLVPHNLNYFTFPVEDYDFDIPEVISAQDPNIEMISIAKLHFTEARSIIRLLIEDITVDDADVVLPTAETRVNIAPQVPFIPTPKAALASHAIFNREY